VVKENPEYMMTKEGQIVPLPSVTPPAPVEPEEVEEVAYRPEPMPVPVEPEEEEEDELADLFEVPQPEDNDMRTGHLVEVPEEADFSDLIEVSEADIMGDDFPGTPPSTETPETRRVPVKRFKRTPRRYPPPPTLGGVRY